MSTTNVPHTDKEITEIKNALSITFLAAKLLADKNPSSPVSEIISIEKTRQRNRLQNHSLTSKK